MKYFLTIITICLFTLSAWAQPTNDDCDDFIHLGLAPICTDDIYTNVDATATDIGAGNSPTCFSGIAPTQDVFFAFTVDPAFVDLTINITGSTLGLNGVAITNPEVALYRGDCVNGLAELLCASSGINGNTIVRLDLLGLTAGAQYIIRVNNATDTGSPLWGDFQLCIEEYIPDVIMGELDSSDACFGTLFDSGGDEEDYSNDEYFTFTVCPTEVPECIALDIASFGIIAGDELNIYAGEDTDAPEIASLINVNNGNNFTVLASSACVTIEFISDAATAGEGFELSWQCDAAACDGSTFDNPTPISGIPYNNTNLSTCGEGATFNQTPCGDNAFFLNGPELVLEYTSEGGYCATVEVIDAAAGTGVLVLDGPPNDPATQCLASANNGNISNVSFEEAGVYYIVVANPYGCTDFGLRIQETICALSSALVDALCNPLNGCVDAEMTSSFTFTEGFGDIPFNTGENDGCWGDDGFDGPNYVWFSVQAAEDGPFGFILEGTNYPSDIDFNVWGPFTVDQVCETPEEVIDAATNMQPIRSSYAGGADPTGLADVHPSLGYDIEDDYDCEGINDDIVQTIDAQEGEVYIVLVNDWGDEIEDNSISINWDPSDPNVIGPVAVQYTVAANDTSVCAGASVILEVLTGVDNIEWVGDNIGELSCTDCFTPTATPTETTVYQAALDLVCYIDTIDININVFDLDAGPDWTICVGEEFQIPAGADFETADYVWSPPVGLEFDCIDCGSPIIIAQSPGTYEVGVTLTAEACSFMDMVTVTVLDNPAPTYTIADDQQTCAGETVAIGGDATAGHNYIWSSVPTGDPIDFISNPLVAPTQTTTYYLNVTNAGCPVTSTDSITVFVTQLPIIDIIASADTICAHDTISLQNSIMVDDVVYSWSGPEVIFDPDTSYTEAIPSVTGAYTLVGNRAGCFSEDVINIEVIMIDVDLLQPDTVLLCFGEEVTLSPFVQPTDIDIQWNQAGITVNNPTLSPSTNTTYIASVVNDICVLMDTMYIQVDSIPMDMTITADPEKDSYCQGELVQLLSPIYEPANYPHIEHEWEQIGMETSDTLYNFVLTTVDTFTYIRTTTSGACSNMDTIVLNVISNNMMITPAASTICEGESIQLLVSADTLGIITWTPTTDLSCTDCPNPTATPSSTTSYTASTEIDGCPVEASATINILALPIIDLIADQVACSGTSLNLNIAPGEADVTYLWSSSAEPSFTSTEPSITVIAGATSTYTLTATNACGETTSSVTISQAIEPSIIMPTDFTVCIGSAFSLEATVLNGGNITSEVWIYNGESELGNPTEFIAMEGGISATFNVEYSGDTEACGIITGTTNIDVVNQIYTIAIETDPANIDTINGGESFILTAVVDPPAGFDYTYTWTGEGVESPNDQVTGAVTPNPEVATAFEYTLTVSSPEGCDQTISTIIIARPLSFDLPNIFSPNGDGFNDLFKIFTNDPPANYSLKIFNRWGQLVFETTDPNEGWNGTLSDGVPVPSEVYIYEMSSSAVYMPEPIRGQVTLIR